MTNGLTIIPDYSGVNLLSLPKCVDNVYWLNGVIHEGEPSVNEIKDGDILTF